MKKVLFVLGSLREGSFNRQVMDEAKAQLEGRVEVSDLHYSDVPFMNQDLEWPTPAAVQRVRDEVGAADALWIVTPQYNGSYPGHVKNLIDWLSRPVAQGSPATVLRGKRVTFTGIGGKTTTAQMREKLGELLPFVGMSAMDETGTGLSLPVSAWTTGTFELDDEQRAAIKGQAESFLAFIEA